MTQIATTTQERMPASVLTGPRKLNIEHMPTPSIARDEVPVEVAAVVVCGSDTFYSRRGQIGDFVDDGPPIRYRQMSKPCSYADHEESADA